MAALVISMVAKGENGCLAGGVLHELDMEGHFGIERRIIGLKSVFLC